MIGVFRGDGELAELYRGIAWDATPLGDPDAWSPALRSALDMALNTRFPVTLLWGPELILLYNEAYVAMIGDKHPAALGRPTREVFAEVWDTIGPMLHGVLAGAGPTWVENARLLLKRHGFLEETFFTFSYSPARGVDGAVEGVIDIAAETTRQVVDRRRLELLDRLGAALSGTTTQDEVAQVAMDVLTDARDDVAAVELRFAERAGDLPDEPGAPAEDVSPSLTADAAGARVAHVPVGSAAGAAGHLSITLPAHLPPGEQLLTFLRLVGARIDHALNHQRVFEAERRALAVDREIVETMQRSLLAAPVSTEALTVAAHYQPAVEQAHIGGDWYDSFVLDSGALAVVIGDVAGHDRDAAAAMGEVRNLLRGTAFASQAAPAAVLSGLDAALRALTTRVYATAALAHIVRDGAGFVLTWSNAGHPPPAVVAPDGAVTLLGTRPDMLLGMRRRTTRHDESITLAPGSTVVLYTDGLIERRDEPIDDGLAALAAALAGTQHRSPEEICALLLERFPESGGDDVALLVVQTAAAAAGR